MSEILVYSEQDELCCELLTQARALGTPVAAHLGASTGDAAAQFAAFGATKIYRGEHAHLAGAQPDILAGALAQIARLCGAPVILIGSTRSGKDVAARLAQKLGCGALVDVIELDRSDGKPVARRLALGGNTVATLEIDSMPQVIALAPRACQATAASAAGQIVQVDLDLPQPRVRVAETRAKAQSTARVEQADRLVVVGKGFASREELTLADDLSRVLGAEVGCTRALAADYHWLGEERMIGVSGRKAKPNLAVSVGVSGQIQHTVGISSAKWIVAINKDKAAPIFQIADYGIVGDLKQVLPLLTERLGRR